MYIPTTSDALAVLLFSLSGMQLVQNTSIQNLVSITLHVIAITRVAVYMHMQYSVSLPGRILFP